MTEVDALTGALEEHHLYHASRAEPFQPGHPDQARAADHCALEPTADPAEQAVLQQRIMRWCSWTGNAQAPCTKNPTGNR